MENKKKKAERGNPAALLPIAVFLVLFAVIGIVSGDFYSMPAIVGFVIALIVALLQNRKLNFEEKMAVFARGAGDTNVVTMILIFIFAGAFSGIVKAAGGVESTVNFGLSVLPSGLAVLGVFVIGCFISTSMGTSVGTITALTPIAVGISAKTGMPIALCVGAVVCGAMFGDNLSMISDTTIAACRTQGCEMKDKFKQNFLIVLPAAIITVVLFVLKASGGNYSVQGDLSYNFFQILPYLIVLVGALVGLNVFIVLGSGIVASAIVGILIVQKFTFLEMFKILGDGIMSMYDISIISLIVAGVVSLVKENGGIQFILNAIRSRVRTTRGAELGIAGLASLVDICTANNTIAIVIAAPIAKEIGDEYGVKNKTVASLLDIFTSVFQGIIPYGAQLLTAASLAAITPVEIIPNLYYPILMGVSAIVFIIFKILPGQRKIEKREAVSEIAHQHEQK